MTVETAAQAHALRIPALHKRRDLKMARSAHAYVRGSTERFYEWLTSDRGRGMPQGPTVWICGDAHVGNLGPIARCDERIEVELRDLDQTVRWRSRSRESGRRSRSALSSPARFPPQS